MVWGWGIYQWERETSKDIVGKQKESNCDSSGVLWKIGLPVTQITQQANSI